MSLIKKVEEQRQAAAAARAAQEQAQETAKKESAREGITRLLAEREELKNLEASSREASEQAGTAKKTHQEKRKVLTEARDKTLSDEDVNTLPVPNVLRKSVEYGSEPEVVEFSQALEDRASTKKKNLELSRALEGRGADLDRINSEIKQVFMEHPEKLDDDLEALRQEMVEAETLQVIKSVETNRYLRDFDYGVDDLISHELLTSVADRERFFRDKERAARAITHSLLTTYFERGTSGALELFEDIQVRILKNGESTDSEDWQVRKISAFLRKFLFNVYENEEGKLSSVSPFSGLRGRNKEKLAMAMIANEDGVLEDRFANKNGYGQKVEGVSYKGSMELASMLDESILRVFATKIIRYLGEKRKLDAWDGVVAAKEKQITSLRDRASLEDTKIRDAQNRIDHNQRQIQSDTSYKEKELGILEAIAQIGEEDKATIVSINPESYSKDDVLKFPGIEALEAAALVEFKRQKSELYKDEIALLKVSVTEVQAEADVTGIPFINRKDNRASKSERISLLQAQIQKYEADRDREAGEWYRKNLTDGLFAKKSELKKIFAGKEQWLKDQGQFDGTLGELLALYEEQTKANIVRANRTIAEYEGNVSQFQGEKAAVESEKERLVEESNVIFRELHDENGAYSRNAKIQLSTRVVTLKKQIAT
jgi:hypothetical protein